MLTRLTWPDANAWSSFFYLGKDGIGLFDLLLWCGFAHFAYAKSQAVGHPGHCPGRREWGCVIALDSQRLQSHLGGQTCRGQRGAKRRVLLGMRLGQVTQSLGHVGMRVFPTVAATAGSPGPEAQEVCTPFGEAKCDRMASLTKHTFGLAGVTTTILQRHCCLKGAPCSSHHFRGS
jgi:hypothetical protein